MDSSPESSGTQTVSRAISILRAIATKHNHQFSPVTDLLLSQASGIPHMPRQMGIHQRLTFALFKPGNQLTGYPLTAGIMYFCKNSDLFHATPVPQHPGIVQPA